MRHVEEGTNCVAAHSYKLTHDSMKETSFRVKTLPLDYRQAVRSQDLIYMHLRFWNVGQPSAFVCALHC